jgi:hypothetical protein
MSESDADDFPPPLTNRFGWVRRAVMTGIALVVIGVILLINHPVGWVGVLLTVAVLAAAYSWWAWLRAQHTIQVRGDALRIIGWRRTVDVAGADVTAVRYVMNRESPDFTLVTTEGRHTVRTSRLEKGHSTLFRWLLDAAPQAELDKRSQRVLELLEIRGLLP